MRCAAFDRTLSPLSLQVSLLRLTLGIHKQQASEYVPFPARIVHMASLWPIVSVSNPCVSRTAKGEEAEEKESHGLAPRVSR